MPRPSLPVRAVVESVVLLAATVAGSPLAAGAAEPHQTTGSPGANSNRLRALLDAPLLFVKRHPYMAAHIYDDYITWKPGGGIYVLENPADPPERHRVRAVIDPNTKETLGVGVYRDAELSWDARKIVFAFKGAANGHTSIYEIGLDGTGLRRLTDPDCGCQKPQTCRIGAGHHDVKPHYLPDGRIVFTSTRPRALVPCFNSGVDTLHVMDADGGNIHTISVNLTNEFDPSVMHDGRILYGRWEYVDKTALYMQSLWTVSPDGRMEEALFANNLARPTAVLQARPVPNSRLVVAALTPHNGQAVGAIAMIDPHQGKNDLKAITNFTHEYPTEMDQGLRYGPSDPWPLSEDVVLITDNAPEGHGVIRIIDRWGNRELIYRDPEISSYAAQLVKPRPAPAVLASHAEPSDRPGRFLVVDVYQGLEDVPRGTIKRLRVVEETARTSGLPPGGRWWNQAFLVSWQGAYIIKNVLGTVPVLEDGSAHFEAPPGRALYFEALDADGREIHRMRTFVQAVPGVTRSCVGCHENKKSAPLQPGSLPLAALQSPSRPEPESWGSGYVDYPSMVQPVWDKHCVRCHGGPEGMAKGLDLSGGWTWAFSISYETLIKHRLVGYLNCNNGSVHTARLIRPRTIGSGGAPLAEILVKKHPELSRADRDLVLAWMDTNCNYHGSWDYTEHATCGAILEARAALAATMQEAGCTRCHQPGHIGNDWINLQTPEWSRILRAPMAKSVGPVAPIQSPPGGKPGPPAIVKGLEFCRNRKARTGYPLVDQGVQPPDVLYPTRQPEWDPSGDPHISFTSTDNPHYQAMLAVIRQTRAEALAKPRVDMPGAEVQPGECRMMVPPRVPKTSPSLVALPRADGAVELSWARTAETIGLQYEVHRGTAADFKPDAKTRLATTTAGRYVDLLPPVGKQHYALRVTSGQESSPPAWASVDVAAPPPPAPPSRVTATPLPGQISLSWEGGEQPGLAYELYRAKAGTQQFVRLNRQTLSVPSYTDPDVATGTEYAYMVHAVDRRGQQSGPSGVVRSAALPEISQPVFCTRFAEGPVAALHDGTSLKGVLHGGAKMVDGVLQLGSSGYMTFAHRPEFDLGKAFSVECRLRIEKETTMPVVVGCGSYPTPGWFIQRYGRGWRWNLGGAACDGGQPAVGRWVHLAAVFDGRRALLYQDGKPVRSVECYPDRTRWSGPLVVGQFSRQSPQYQTAGCIAELKLYARALKPEEILAAARH